MLTCLNETRPRQMEHDCSPASLSCSIQTQRMHNMALPYRSTPVFDETSLPAALRGEHRTKEGVWGLIRVLEGKLQLNIIDPPSEEIHTTDNSGVVKPDQPHFVPPLVSLRRKIAFSEEPPALCP